MLERSTSVNLKEIKLRNTIFLNIFVFKYIIKYIKNTQLLIKSLGLRWDPQCLTPEKNERAVNTASQQQVRKSIYKHSSLEWKNYEQYLDGRFHDLPQSFRDY